MSKHYKIVRDRSPGQNPGPHLQKYKGRTNEKNL